MLDEAEVLLNIAWFKSHRMSDRRYDGGSRFQSDRGGPDDFKFVNMISFSGEKAMKLSKYPKRCLEMLICF